MDLKTIEEHFGVLLDEPGAHADLKQLILELAARGSLVPPDQSDKSTVAHVPPKKKWAGNAELRTTATPKLAHGAVPHPLPETWRWIPITDAFNVVPVSKKKIKSSEIQTDGRFPVVDQGKEFISGQADDEERVLRLQNPVVVFGDHTCEIKYVDFDFIPGADGTKVLSPLNVHPKYFYWMLKRIKFEDKGYSRHFKFLTQNWFPLAPLHEQLRIVTKIEQLMQLCDELEQQQQRATKARKRFNAASLEDLASARDAYEFESSWKRLESNFSFLCQDFEDTKRLKQLVYDFGVLGHLTRSHSNDRSIHDLLSEFDRDRQDKRIRGKAFKNVEMPKPAELPVIPTSWTWVQLHKICSHFDYGTSEKSHSHPDGVPVLRMNNISHGEVVLDFLKYVPSSIDGLPELLLKENDILFNRTNSYELVGKTGVFIGESDTFTFASYLIRIRCRPEMNPNYINLFFQSSFCRRLQIEPHITQQTNQANFNGTKLKSIWLPLPPPEEQSRICERASMLLRSIDSLSAKIKSAGHYRSRLATCWTTWLIKEASIKQEA